MTSRGAASEPRGTMVAGVTGRGKGSAWRRWGESQQYQACEVTATAITALGSAETHTSVSSTMQASRGCATVHGGCPGAYLVQPGSGHQWRGGGGGGAGAHALEQPPLESGGQ